MAPNSIAIRTRAQSSTRSNTTRTEQNVSTSSRTRSKTSLTPNEKDVDIESRTRSKVDLTTNAVKLSTVLSTGLADHVTE